MTETQTIDQVADETQERRWRLRVEAAERLDDAYQELMQRVDEALDAARAVGLSHVVARFEAYAPFDGGMGPAELVAELRESLAIELTDSDPCRDCPHDFGRHRGQPEPDLCSPGCPYWMEDGRGHARSCAAAERDESSCDKCACAAFASWGIVR